MNGILLATHFVAFLGTMHLCRHSQRVGNSTLLLVLGVLGFPLFGLLTLALLDFSDHAGNGTTGAWYLIFSAVTLGLAPIVTHLSAAASGVCVYRVLQYWRA